MEYNPKNDSFKEFTGIKLGFMKQYEISEVTVDSVYLHGKIVAYKTPFTKTNEPKDTLMTIPGSAVNLYSLQKNLKGKNSILRATTNAAGNFTIKLNKSDLFFLASDEYPFTNTLYEVVLLSNLN